MTELGCFDRSGTSFTEEVSHHLSFWWKTVCTHSEPNNCTCTDPQSIIGQSATGDFKFFYCCCKETLHDVPSDYLIKPVWVDF